MSAIGRLPISSSQFDKNGEQDRTNIDPTPLFRAPPPRLGQNGKVMRKEYVCFKEGDRRNSKATSRSRGLTREHCGAKLAVDMYEIRDRWVLAYTNHMFSVHMTSSQRAESSYSFFKRYVSKENSMMAFVMWFNRALDKVRHNELDLDHKDVNEKPLLKTSWAMEKKMNEIYTRSIFERFQEEIFQINAYMVMLIRENEHWYLWNVQKEEMEGTSSSEISVDKSSNRVSCSYKMFEFDGIPCWHLLAYLFRMQIRELPTEYILQRWTKTAKAGRVMDDLVIDDVVLDEEESEVVREALESSQKKIALMRSSRVKWFYSLHSNIFLAIVLKKEDADPEKSQYIKYCYAGGLVEYVRR
ncbi:hypothetical protein RHSIM_Rhsim05G0115200 [Rhododendron simsii]|uniref:Protein FAR1-RELATED SEQUENCE n=1 Tax=Rhododendron simsii TaxID=118357 RepID=A0A834LQ76_RHOSS|nr:hypothetical protein RHSIM_Rhsim05G0115200 [Rhododendron simsii]